MKRDDLVYICAMTANLSGLPVRLYEGDRLLSHFSMTPLPRDPILLVRPEITAIDRHVGFYISKRFYVYGVVSSGRRRIVVGPTRQAPPQDTACMYPRMAEQSRIRKNGGRRCVRQRGNCLKKRM